MAHYKLTIIVCQRFLIHMSVLLTRSNQKGSMRKISNQKAFMSMSVLQRRANKNYSRNLYKCEYEQSKRYQG